MTFASAIRLSTAAWGIAVAAAILAVPPQAFAQAGPDAAGQEAAAPGEDLDRVYATVDGMAITEGDLAVAAEDYAQQLGRSALEVPIPELLNVLIDMQLLAKAAEEAGFDDRDAVKRRIAFERARTLRNAYLREGALAAVTDESVRARYDSEVAEFEPEDEFRLRHILVDTEDEGIAIIAEIDAGGDFAAIATEKSKDPGSAANGGDLDFVAQGATIPEFEAAAFALEVGEYTKEPVKSDYGWHVIKLEETRKSSPPEFASEVGRIRNDMLREYVTNEIATLRANAEIEIAAPPPGDGGSAPGEAESPAAPGDDGAGAPAQ